MKTADEHFSVWAEIDLEAIAHNIAAVRQLITPGTDIMAVVKADAYGHGIVNVARTAHAAGVDAFGVARLGEALALRKSGFKNRILIFGYTPPAAAGELINNNLIQTVFSRCYAAALNEKARNAKGRIKIHIKIDTGMGRLGLLPATLRGVNEDIKKEKSTICNSVASIVKLTNLETEGIFTHFAASDSYDKKSAGRQLTLFREVTSLLEADGVHIPVKHAANSGAVIDLPEAHLDMVRPGIMLYGLYPSAEVAHHKVILRPAMQVKARIAQVKNVSKGFRVSYGETHITSGPTRLATVPVGYADGYRRKLSSSGVMLVKGVRAPVVGRVCMDQSVIDVGHIKDVHCGDEVVIIGRQGEAVLSAEEMARELETINYEIVSALMARVPRIYSGLSSSS
ncbi:MAG: alanine racemase [Deltaproteobacteria bacterium]|nr:alanine racemase [Deltaproteobacteria bacterium]